MPNLVMIRKPSAPDIVEFVNCRFVVLCGAANSHTEVQWFPGATGAGRLLHQWCMRAVLIQMIMLWFFAEWDSRGMRKAATAAA